VVVVVLVVEYIVRKIFCDFLFIFSLKHFTI